MSSRRYQAMEHLAARLAAVLSVPVLHNVPEAQEVSPAGMVVLTDGELGEPEVTLGVRHWSWEAAASVSCLVANAEAAARRLAVDMLATAAIEAIEDDPTLGGLVDWCEARPTGVVHEAETGAAAVAEARIELTLHYQTTTAAG